MSEVTIVLGVVAVGAIVFDVYAFKKLKQNTDKHELKAKQSSQLVEQRKTIMKGIAEKGSDSFEPDEKPLMIVGDECEIDGEPETKQSNWSDIKKNWSSEPEAFEAKEFSGEIGKQSAGWQGKQVEVDLKDLESDYNEQDLNALRLEEGGDEVLNSESEFDAEKAVADLSSTIATLNKRIASLEKKTKRKAG